LIYGDLHWLILEQNLLVFKRTYFNDEVIVAFNKSPESKTLPLDVTQSYQTQFRGVLQFENGKASLTLPPYSFEIITRATK
jgi:glycosidase